MDREKLERRHEGTDKDVGFTRCLKEDGSPNCSMCHGPFYYCTKDHNLRLDNGHDQFGLVACNRGKVKLPPNNEGSK